MTQPTANPGSKWGWPLSKGMHGTSPQLWFLILRMWILVVSNDATRRIIFLPFFFFPYRLLVAERLCRNTCWYLERRKISTRSAVCLPQGLPGDDTKRLSVFRRPHHTYLTWRVSPYINLGQFVQEGLSWGWQWRPAKVRSQSPRAPTAPGWGDLGTAQLLAEELGCSKHHILAFQAGGSFPISF